MIEIKGIINFSSRTWYGKTNFNGCYTGGRCADDIKVISESNQGRLPTLCLLTRDGLVVTRSGRVVARFRYHESGRGNNVWLSKPDKLGEYVKVPRISEREINSLLSPDYGDGNTNPCPKCGRYMEWGECRWTDCGN